MCKQYNIDESHGTKHAKGTVRRALMILDKLPNVSEKERRLVVYAAALHDICDHKYVNVSESSSAIKRWLVVNQGWSESDAETVIEIIKSMSYSQLKMNFLTGYRVYPNHGIWQRAYHVVRHADLLEGFIVARCVLYNKHIHPELPEEDHWRRAAELFKNRVFTYVSEGWISMPEALVYVKELEAEARRCLSERSLDWP